MLVCAYTVHFCTRDRGCQSAPGFPCALCLERANEFAKARAERAARSRTLALSPSSLRTQGPIRRGGCYLKKVVDGFASTVTDGGYGSLLSQGRHQTRTSNKNGGPSGPPLM